MEEISCSTCDNRTIPSSIMGKIGQMLSAEETDWIAEVREMRCAGCIKNLPFQPEEMFTLAQAVEVGSKVAAELIKGHRSQWVNTLEAQLRDGLLLIPKKVK